MSKKYIVPILVFLVFIGLFFMSVQIAKFFMGSSEPAVSDKKSVGLVEVKGMILDSKETVRQLRYFYKNDDSHF